MKTKLIDKENIDEVASIISAGGIVAFPTDTVYGLAVSSNDFTAIKNMQIAKGRPENKPFPMMVNSLSQIEMVGVVNDLERKIIENFMPGALTIILNKKVELANVVTNGFSTVGVRMPDDEWILDLIDIVGCPLLVPSANLSGELSCTSSSEVLLQLNGRIDGVVEGHSMADTASTIIQVIDDEINVIRQGKLTIEEIRGKINEG